MLPPGLMLRLALGLLWGLAAAMDTGLAAVVRSAVSRQLAVGDDAAAVAGCLGDAPCPVDARFESLMLLAIDMDRPRSLLVLVEHAAGLSDEQRSRLPERTLTQHRVDCCLALLAHGLRFVLGAGSNLQVRALWAGTYGWTAGEARRLLAADPDGCFTPNLQHFARVPSAALALLMVEVLLGQRQCVVEDVLWCAATFPLPSLSDAGAAAVFRALLQRDFSRERPALPARLIRDFSRANPGHRRALCVLLGDRRLGLPRACDPERCSPYLAGALPLLRACDAGDAGDAEQLRAGLAGAGVGYDLLDVLLQRAAAAAGRARRRADAARRRVPGAGRLPTGPGARPAGAGAGAIRGAAAGALDLRHGPFRGALRPPGRPGRRPGCPPRRLPGVGGPS